MCRGAILWYNLEYHQIVPWENSRRHLCCQQFRNLRRADYKIPERRMKPKQKARTKERSHEVIAQTDEFKQEPKCVIMSIFLPISSFETGTSIYKDKFAVTGNTQLNVQRSRDSSVDHPNCGYKKQLSFQNPTWQPNSCTILGESNLPSLSLSFLICRKGTLH